MTDMFLVRSMIQLAQHEADYGAITIKQNVTAGKTMLTHESMRLPEGKIFLSSACVFCIQFPVFSSPADNKHGQADTHHSQWEQQRNTRTASGTVMSERPLFSGAAKGLELDGVASQSLSPTHKYSVNMPPGLLP